MSRPPSPTRSHSTLTRKTIGHIWCLFYKKGNCYLHNGIGSVKLRAEISILSVIYGELEIGATEKRKGERDSDSEREREGEIERGNRKEKHTHTH